MSPSDNFISTYSSAAMIKYAIERGVDLYDLIVRFRELPHILMDGDSWIDLESWEDVAKKISSLLNKSMIDISYEIAKDSANSNFKLLVLQLTPLKKLLSFLASFMNKEINRNICINILDYSYKDKVLVLEFRPLNNNKNSVMICDYNHGSILGIMESKGFYGVSVDHKECVCKSGDTCIFKISWAGEVGVFNKIGNYIKNLFNSKESYKLPEYMNRGIPINERDIENLFKGD